MSEYTDHDGTRLLFIEEVAEKMGTAVSTVRRYATAAKRQRRARRRRGIYDFPVPVKHVFREVPKRGSDIPNTVNSPLWREDQIQVWMDNKRGPRGRPAKRDEEVS